MTAFRMILLAALVAIGRPAAAQVVQQYDYAPDRIYTVRTGLGITTEIELSSNEKILDYSAGFSSGWDLTRRDNVFYLRPKNVDVDTNLMIRTETHAYIFELKVVATDWKALDQAKQSGVQYKVTFRYPNGTRFVAKVDEAPQASPRLVPKRPYYFNYGYATRTEATWLIPVNVYDDGQFTYIRMNDLKGLPTGNFPAVFGRHRLRDEDFVVNTSVEDNVIVVHGVYPFLVIRQGSNVIGIRRGGEQ